MFGLLHGLLESLCDRPQECDPELGSYSDWSNWNISYSGILDTNFPNLDIKTVPVGEEPTQPSTTIEALIVANQTPSVDHLMTTYDLEITHKVCLSDFLIYTVVGNESIIDELIEQKWVKGFSKK